MSPDTSFCALVQRVRAGESDAAAELVRTYEPEIRRAVRVWATNPRMGRVLDSMDICQSVLANFFVRAAAGQFDLERPEQLLGLLVKMAKNKLRDYWRKETAERRDVRRRPGGDAEVLEGVPGCQATPSRVVAGQELLQAALGRMSDAERQLAVLRGTGRTWEEIAAEAGSTPAAVRMRLTRALDRVASEMNLNEVSHA
jgi:RNA polymerase sigma factor (sigma-70 family)